MQYKKYEIEPQTSHGGEIAFKVLLTTMILGILVTYFTN